MPILSVEKPSLGGVIDTNNNLYCSIAGFNTGPVMWHGPLQEKRA